MSKTKDNCNCGKNCNCNSTKPDTTGGKVSQKSIGCGVNSGGVTSDQPYSNICDVNRPFNNQYAPTGMENADQTELEPNTHDKAKAMRADKTPRKD